MTKSRITQFKLVLVLSISLALLIGTSFIWAMFDFSSRHALFENQFLSKYTERAISRYHVNPDNFFTQEDQLLSQPRVALLSSYNELKRRFPYVPDETTFDVNTTKAVFVKYRGFLKVPDYLLVKSVLVDDQKFYGYLLVDDKLNDLGLDFRAFEKAQPFVFVVLIIILLLVLVGLFQINRINSSIYKFAQWANLFSAGVDEVPAPAFSSSTFSSIELEIEKNLSDISQVLTQEHSFAKFASHELRTPIAVLSANMDLLEVLMKDSSPRERKALQNMTSAVSDMKYQMEALLWLSRADEGGVDFAECSLRGLVDKALHDNSYLLTGKNVQTQIIGDDISAHVNAVFMQIILNNLVRNAYQNTQNGRVDIQLSKNMITIANEDDLTSPALKKDVGFGIGLALVTKLVHKLGIRYEIEKRPNGHCVKLIF